MERTATGHANFNLGSSKKESVDPLLDYDSSNDDYENFDYYYDDEDYGDYYSDYYDDSPRSAKVRNNVVPALVKLWQETQ